MRSSISIAPCLVLTSTRFLEFREARKRYPIDHGPEYSEDIASRVGDGIGGPSVCERHFTP